MSNFLQDSGKKMEFQEGLRAANEIRIKPAGTDQSKLHITAKGKEGRALRKKLAIAMGLRVSSSGTPSTVDSDEELEIEDTSQNVMEMFRKQIKMTAAQKKQSPNFNLDWQQVKQEGSSVLLKRTIRKQTSTRTEYADEEDDFNGMNYDERSTDHRESTSSSRGSRHSVLTQSQLSKSHTAAEKTNRNNHMTSHNTSTQKQIVAHDDASAGLPAEEIFSSFGEQSESSAVTKVSSIDSVKHLREKIRKNARARKLPRPIAGKNTTEKTENTIDRQRKLSGSQIPIRVVNNSEGKIEDKKESPIPKSKIPRRKSQNAADRKESFTKSDTKIETLLTDIFSTNEAESKPTDKLKVDLQEIQKGGVMNQDIITINVNQELQSNCDTLLDGEESATGSTRKDISKSTSAVKVTNTNLKRSLSHHKTVCDFDAIISELEKLKVSLCKTYDDFHEMKELTVGLSKELKAFRNI